MKITIDPKLRTPVYQQIVDEVKRLVGSGTVRPGDRMASVRELSRALGVNPATVAKAYRELVREGLLRTTSTSGTFVGGAAGRLSPELSRAKIDRALDRFFAEVAACELGEKEIAAAFRRRLGEFASGRTARPLRARQEAAPAREPSAPRRAAATQDWAVW